MLRLYRLSHFKTSCGRKRASEGGRGRDGGRDGGNESGLWVGKEREQRREMREGAGNRREAGIKRREGEREGGRGE